MNQENQDIGQKSIASDKETISSDQENITRVLAFGTFDIFHPGHEHHLKEAAKLGDELYVVVARDKTVETVKGHLPRNNETKRLTVISSLPYVAKALLGHDEDHYSVIEEIAPDVIVLGYDQKAFVDGLRPQLSARGLNPKIVRFSKGFEPERYKSSKLRPKYDLEM